MLEEVVNLAALLISLGAVEHSVHGLFSEVLTDIRHRKHNLFHSAIMADNLKESKKLVKL